MALSGTAQRKFSGTSSDKMMKENGKRRRKSIKYSSAVHKIAFSVTSLLVSCDGKNPMVHLPWYYVITKRNSGQIRGALDKFSV